MSEGISKDSSLLLHEQLQLFQAVAMGALTPNPLMGWPQYL